MSERTEVSFDAALMMALRADAQKELDELPTPAQLKERYPDTSRWDARLKAALHKRRPVLKRVLVAALTLIILTFGALAVSADFRKAVYTMIQKFLPIEMQLTYQVDGEPLERLPDGYSDHYTVIGTKGVYLSGGEQQRIAIARAMLKNAPILLLDEATAFADPDNEAKVQAAFAQLAKGKTVLMIAHRLSTVANADCIYVVQDGQIVESGTKDELCAQNGLFARMWQEYQASVQWKVAKEG